jgi:hypothetical protein
VLSERGEWETQAYHDIKVLHSDAYKEELLWVTDLVHQGELLFSSPVLQRIIHVMKTRFVAGNLTPAAHSLAW